MKDKYVNLVNFEYKNEKTKEIILQQINNYFDAKKYVIPSHNYKIGDRVFLKVHTLLHGTYRNIDGLKEILKEGILGSLFTGNRLSKYPSCCGVWNLKKDYYLSDYINFYSGGTIRFNNLMDSDTKTRVIPFNELDNIKDIVLNSGFQRWSLEQTKEARFLPSLVQNNIQIGIIFNSENEYIKRLLENDILSLNIDDESVKEFVSEYYYDRFIIDRKNKDDFFTDRESAILFGIPSNFIEGIIVGRLYEKDNNILKEIKELLPNAYICNLDGFVIIE